MKKIIFLLFLLSSCQACKDTTLIDISEPESTDVFRCKVNGVDWEPAGNSVSIAGGNLDAYYFNYLFTLSASKKENDINQYMSMSVSVFDGVLGEHFIGTNNIFTDYKSNCERYYRDTTSINIINITEIDSTANTIEGIFQFKGLSQICPNNPIEVTDGYFKIKYRN